MWLQCIPEFLDRVLSLDVHILHCMWVPKRSSQIRHESILDCWESATWDGTDRDSTWPFVSTRPTLRTVTKKALSILLCGLPDSDTRHVFNDKAAKSQSPTCAPNNSWKPSHVRKLKTSSIIFGQVSMSCHCINYLSQPLHGPVVFMIIKIQWPSNDLFLVHAMDKIVLIPTI